MRPAASNRAVNNRGDTDPHDSAAWGAAQVSSQCSLFAHGAPAHSRDSSCPQVDKKQVRPAWQASLGSAGHPLAGVGEVSFSELGLLCSYPAEALWPWSWASWLLPGSPLSLGFHVTMAKGGSGQSTEEGWGQGAESPLPFLWGSGWTTHYLKSFSSTQVGSTTLPVWGRQAQVSVASNGRSLCAFLASVLSTSWKTSFWL